MECEHILNTYLHQSVPRHRDTLNLRGCVYRWETQNPRFPYINGDSLEDGRIHNIYSQFVDEDFNIYVCFEL